jgi:RNA polymerase sigma factor (sigma-70 family)
LRRLNRLLLEDAYPLALRTPLERQFTIAELKARIGPAWIKAFAKLTTIGVWTLKSKTFVRNWPLKTEDFEEIIDDALVQTYRNIDEYDTCGGLVTYFRKATIHLAIDRLRRGLALKRGQGKVMVTHDLSEVRPPDPNQASQESGLPELEPDVLDWTVLDKLLPSIDPSQVGAAQVAELRLLLRDLLDELEERDRNLIEYYFYDSLKDREVAEKIGRPVNEVGIKRQRALEKLARKIPLNLKQEMETVYGPKRVRTS